MNCLECRKHSLIIVGFPDHVKIELYCWNITGGQLIPYKPEEVGTYVVMAPDWCPLARCQKKEEVRIMTVNEARLALMNTISEHLPEHQLIPLDIIYAVDKVEKAAREEGPRVPLEDSPLPK